MNRNLQIAVALILAAAFAALGYFYYSQSQDPVGLMNPASGQLAPDFALPDLEGNHWQLSQHRGQVLLINFWATWCAPCREEMPALERLHQALGSERFEVIGIHSGPSSDMDQFLAETPVSFTILMDTNLALDDWRIQALPTTFLIDAEGHARYWVSGIREWDSAEAQEFFASFLP